MQALAHALVRDKICQLKWLLAELLKTSEVHFTCITA